MPPKQTAKHKNKIAQQELDLFAVVAAQATPAKTNGKNGKAETAAVIQEALGIAEAAPSPPPRKPRERVTAQTLALKQRDISVSEFFAKNRHLLGFDNPVKALLTTVKEAVDNSLDACEEAGILPDLIITINELAEDRYRVAVEDNGPGIVKQQIPKIFGKLLYGSKFHTLKQSRGQQGIGISAAGMYGQLTTGKPLCIISRTGPDHPATYLEIIIDTSRNQPRILKEDNRDWPKEHGTRVELEIQATYKRGLQSVDGYLELTALANPHARIEYRPPKDAPLVYERVTSELPPDAKAIKPHPHGVELGILIKMLQGSRLRNVRSFLQQDFSRVSDRIAGEICAKAGLQPSTSPERVSRDAAEQLHRAIQATKIMAPPTNCLAPIGAAALEAGLRQRVKADFYSAVTRPPRVYRGNPFQVEVGLAYGGDLSGDEPITLVRLANRVPLLYQQGACAIAKAAVKTNWRAYALQHPKGALPSGPVYLMVHISSVWVPFTSESKEAIAHYPEIIEELRRAMQECGRAMALFAGRRRRLADEEKKRGYIESYLPHIGEALQEILGFSDRAREQALVKLEDILERSRKI